jgi:ribosomal protein S18 acetylase RimI-like enzyme
MTDQITLLHLGPEDAHVLKTVRPETFDYAIDPVQARAFLMDPAHEIVVAIDGGHVIGMATGLVVLHPDKQPGFFVNEVGVQDDYLRQGLGTLLCNALFDVARARGCHTIWVVTEGDNAPARALYAALGGQETTDLVMYEWEQHPPPQDGNG